ncbi:hypothetical protein [Botrimarina sp.]|uniref:hypothetical protein n=1 Tax=Botrimarina sp. TaxID=2795802 RepID=UPI0032EDDB92
MKSLLLTLAALAPVAAEASIQIPGAPLDPVADTFGAIPAATFGGSGIPNNQMAISTAVHNGNTITLGIAATQRFDSAPQPLADGMGGYQALNGESDPGLARWNFSFYATIDGPGSFEDYRLVLDYDMDNAAGTPFDMHGQWDLTMGAAMLGADLSTLRTIETSQNLGFGFLDTPAVGVIMPPSASFDPFDVGEYTFLLSVHHPFIGGELIDSVAMAVNVVPEPTAAGLWGVLVGVAGLTTRRGALLG